MNVCVVVPPKTPIAPAVIAICCMGPITYHESEPGTPVGSVKPL